MPQRCTYFGCLAMLGLLTAFGCSPPKPQPAAPGPGLDPTAVALPIRDMEKVEDLSETVANRLIEFSDAVRRRDLDAASAFLTPDFLGTRFHDLAVAETKTLALQVEQRFFDVQPARDPPTDRAAFIASLEKILAPLENVERVFFKTRGAEFEADESRGVLRMTAEMVGRGAAQQPFELYGWAAAEVVQKEGKWQLRRFVLDRLRATTRAAPIFTDVAAAAGLAQIGPRLGTKGNTSFYWRGAAVADVDGDGYYDIFASTHQRNYLYRNRGDGTFADITEAAGLMKPAEVTGPLFLDYDRDGDQDLFCGHVGWRLSGVPFGKALRLYRNDGKGRFADVSEAMGIGNVHASAFSACAADVNNDGWLDIYVCNYNRLDSVYPNSWYKATNGEPNFLLLNRQGKKFEEVAKKSGVAGTGWSYAAAFADYDEDGDQDFYVANDYGENRLYRNRGDGTFEDVAREAGVLDTGNGMGVLWTDLDGDGDLDLYVSNMSSSAGNRILKRLTTGSGRKTEGSASRTGSALSGTQETLFKLAAGNSIFHQTKNGLFERLPPAKGGIGASWAWSASALDVDLDGIQDVYVANGFISGDSLKDT